MRYSNLWLCLVCTAPLLLQLAAFSVDQKKLYDKTNIYGIDFKFGMATNDPKFPALRQAMFDMATKYGATITRSAVGWAEVETVKGQPYDWQKADRKLIWLAEHGLPSCFNLATAPEWAIEPSPAVKEVFRKANAEHLLCQMNIKDEHWPAYERYITDIVQRCGQFVSYYDIWNEPDGMGNPSVYTDENGNPTAIKYGGDPEWYVKLLAHTTPIIRKLDPDAIVGAGCLENKNQPTSEFLEAVYKAGGKPYFHAISIHPYGKPLNFEWLRTVRRIMVDNGDAQKPIWITEYGLNWQKSEGISEEAAAALTRAALRYMRETPWITMGLLHHGTPILWNQGPADPTNLSPKPALIAFKETKNEAGPKHTFSMGMEKDSDLTYWYCEVDGSRNAYPYLTLAKNEFHSGRMSLEAKTDGLWIEPFVGVNVKSKSPTLSFWYKILPANPEAKATLKVEVRPGNIEIPSATITVTETPQIGKWAKAEVSIAKGFPTVEGKTIVDVGIHAGATKPGVVVYLDDITVK